MPTILVPTDFSACARNAARYAIRLAEKTGSQLVFFHSTFQEIPTRSSKTVYQAAVDRELAHQSKKLQQEIDKSYQAVGLSRDPDQTKLLVKFDLSVSQNIREMVQETNADLIVMGTQGASGLRKLLFGSNTADVITKATVPVLAIPQRHRFRPIEKIIYASDMSAVSKEIRALLPWVKPLGAFIEVVYFDYGWDTKGDQSRFDKAVSQFPDVTCRLVRQKVNIDLPLEENLRTYLKRQRKFILASFTTDRDFFDNLFLSSLTKELAYNLTFPLLSIRKAILRTTDKK